MTVRMTKAQLLTLHSYLLDIWTKAAAYSTRLCTLEDLTNDERLTLRDHACSTAVRETLEYLTEYWPLDIVENTDTPQDEDTS
jgi:hypothetical protein